MLPELGKQWSASIQGGLVLIVLQLMSIHRCRVTFHQYSIVVRNGKGGKRRKKSLR
jgi:hypothetical protein